MTRYQALLDELRAEFPGFRLIDKGRAPSQRLIHVLLCALTFGGQRRYSQDFVTTLGQRVYVPSDWDGRSEGDRVSTLRHERVHLRQFRRYGMPLMAIGYLLFPLPIGLAYFRMRIERAAYEESIRAAFELRGRAYVESEAFREHLVGLFCGPAYGWMWPFPRAIRRWHARVLASLPRG